MSRNKAKNELITKERKEDILRAATRMFAQKGYQGTNISDIAKVLHISQGIIFWYFETKENLFKITFREEFMAIKYAAAAILTDNGLTPREKLQKLIFDMLTVYREKKEGCRLILQLLSNQEMQQMLSIDILDIYEELYRDLEKIFKEAGAANPGLKARNFVALLDGFMIQIILGLELGDYDTLVRDILHRYELL